MLKFYNLAPGEETKMLFRKEKRNIPSYPPEEYEPVIRCSICTGEQVACMRSRETGKLHEVMLLRSEKDLQDFCGMYALSPSDIRKIY